MLVLSRKINESIMINGEIEVKIISVEEGRVRLGIVAPKKHEIHRMEVFEKIQQENKSAASSAKSLESLKDLNLKAATSKENK